MISILVGLGLLAGCSPRLAGPDHSSKVSVAAAADLKFALDAVIAEFGKPVEVTYGSSGNFYSQLANHAPFDLFLSADREYPRKLTEAGLTLPDSEFLYALGRIALWVPASSPLDLPQLRMDALRHSSVSHIAIANPSHAPYGRAAEAAMRSSGIYESQKMKLVLGENVAQALQFVESGNAEIGIVALSLALAPPARKQGRYWEVPIETYPRMEQAGVILKWARDGEAARAFRAFLTGPRGRAILKEFGFSQPGA